MSNPVSLILTDWLWKIAFVSSVTFKQERQYRFFVSYRNLAQGLQCKLTIVSNGFHLYSGLRQCCNCTLSLNSFLTGSSGRLKSSSYRCLYIHPKAKLLTQQYDLGHKSTKARTAPRASITEPLALK